MKADIHGNPDYGHVTFSLDPGDTLLVESGAMSWMSADLDVKSTIMGGILSGLARKIFAGESLMLGEYKATKPTTLNISPGMPGQVIHRKIEGTPVIMQAGSFLACTPGVTLSTKFGGLRGLFSGEGVFFLEVSGHGDLWFNAYGAILEKEINGELVVDTGHAVGWDPSLNWEITGVGSLFSTFFSGEGLVIRFKGRGKVWLQTRNESGLANWISGYLRG